MTPISGADPSPELFERWDSLGLVRKPGLRGWFRRHPWWMSAVVVGIYLLWSLWVFPAALIDVGSGAAWLAFGHVVIGGALFFRHVRPIAVLVLVTVFETAMLFYYPWQGAQMMGLCFAAYTVGYRYGLRWGLLIAVPGSALAYSTLVNAPRWIEDNGPSFWMRVYAVPEEVSELWVLMMMAIMMTASVVFATGFGTSVRRGHNHEREILEWARKSHELAQLGERNRIAREMHDVVAHSLSVMISLADGARVVAKKDPERATEVIGEVSATGRGALADMRRLLGVLRKGEDAEGARGPITESLDELHENFRQAGLPLRFEHTGPPLPENAAFGLTVHRIIQESLTNVLRYAQNVRRVEVSIEHQPGTGEEELKNLKAQGFSEREQAALGLSGAAQVIITITDDGVPAGSGARRDSVGSGLGIQGMQERASFYNGSVYAGPGKHNGWMVRALLEPPEGQALTGKGTE